ncbi:DUF4274 domain-containing protein [Candidatus Viadribacter manganicus]|uniref:DUF4274 domain-containing protein n=1 Tax=Candidatus Viadribacter manganicus TaxID=1759059 RepID=A0A1B1AJY3_9PROT|nr:DUF4274 domain-containing protein [Candidatus Viadribacter manganicus]ANP46878.1 hypothetical protein ATE48_13605 [Candidatus Viadribacter manganicus]
MPVSEQRLAEIRELSNDERVDRIDTSQFSDADWERFHNELNAETLAFCRDNRDPEELHAFASTWNWDGGFEALEEITRNPACERATALYIYWHGAPEWYRQYTDRDAVAEAKGDADLFDFLTRIETRYVAGEFALGSIAFDPTNADGEGGYSLVGSYDDISGKFVRSLPPAMYEPIRLK